MSPAPEIYVRVDSFERPSGVPAALAALGVNVDMRRLDAGDYLVARSTRIERKTVRGLHAAVIQGSFWPQLGRLRASCNYPFLLVEGGSIDNGPLPKTAVRGVLVAVVDLGIGLIRSTDGRDSAMWIRQLAIRRQRENPVDRPWFAQRPKRAQYTGEACLVGIPGISTHRARALLAQFGTVAAICGADAPALQQVRGVGPRLADAIVGELHGVREHD